MGFKIMKCPACGGDLNIETDRDFLFCQFCGAKLMKDDQRIVIEHIERKIDEAELERYRLEHEEATETRKTNKKQRKLSGVLALIGTILMGISFSLGKARIGFMLAGEIALFVAMILFFSSDGNSNKTNKN